MKNLRDEITETGGAVISCDTLDPLDLINKFAGALKYGFDALPEELEAEVIDWLEDDFGEPTDDDREQMGWILDELFDLLNDNAPEGYYFGAQEGDGACFGFWSIEEGE